MIERMFDGLKRAASRAKEFMTAEESTKPALFVDFINALKVGAGSAHQLSIYQENPHFLGVRDKIEAVVDFAQNNPPRFTDRQAGLWFTIKTSLEQLAETSVRMAGSRSMKRSQVLVELALREQAARTDGL